jgi:hypothetical protein
MAFETTKQVKFVASLDGADKVDAGFRRIGNSLGNVDRTAQFARSAITALGGAFGVTFFAGAISGAIDAKAKLYDLSLQTGISVEALGGLSKVARLSGTDMEAVASASNKLSKALVTTNEDSVGAAQGIKALGLNFAQFKSLNADQQLLAVAKAMEGFADGTDKSATAMLLFGKSGATLLPFLKELAERGVMATTQTLASAKAAKEFKDNIELLKGAGEGWATSLANLVLPQLVALTKQLLEAKTPAEKLWTLMQNMSANAGFNDVGQATLALKSLNAEVARTEAFYESLLKAEGKHPEVLERTRKKLDELRLKSAEASEQLKRLANVSVGLPPEGSSGPLDTRHFPPKPQIKVPDLDAIARAKKEADDRAARELKQIQENAKERSELRQKESAAIAEFELNEQQRRNKEVEAARNAVASAQAEFDTFGLLRSQIAQLTLQRLQDKSTAYEAGSASAIAVEQEIEAQKELISVLQRGERRDKQFREDPTAGASRAVKAYLEDVQAAGLATERVVDGAIRSMEDTLTTFFTMGKFGARQLVDTLISEFIRLRIVKPMLADIFSGSGLGFFNSILGGGGGFGTGNAFGNLDLAGFLAGGGPARAGSPYLVGERGPELFVPNTSGTVIPNGGGRSVQITNAPQINIDSSTDRAQVTQLVAQGVTAGNQQLVAALHAQGVF